MKTSTLIILAVASMLLAFGSIWAGSYAMEYIADWAKFPAYVSAFIGFCGGVVGAFVCVCVIVDRPKSGGPLL